MGAPIFQTQYRFYSITAGLIVLLRFKGYVLKVNQPRKAAIVLMDSEYSIAVYREYMVVANLATRSTMYYPQFAKLSEPPIYMSSTWIKRMTIVSKEEIVLGDDKGFRRFVMKTNADLARLK